MEFPLSANATREHSARFFNRELSWLAFNDRVLAEACNTDYPLLERLRFLSISGSNLDEFMMIRVAGLVGQVQRGIEKPSIDGLTPTQQLAEVRERLGALSARQQEIFSDLRELLADAGIHMADDRRIGQEAHEWLRQHFLDEIMPVITPQALDPGHPFPFISNEGLGVLFTVRRQEIKANETEELVEMVLIPSALPRFLRVPGDEAIYIGIENLITRFAEHLFPGFEMRGSGVFRVLRDSDIEIEEEAEDLVRTFRSAIQRRRRGQVIQLELEEQFDPTAEALLRERLATPGASVVKIDGMLGMAGLSDIVKEDRPDLKFDAYSPRYPERVREHDGDCFAAIREKDIVVHHPYESFAATTQRFIEEAAEDPKVLAIKLTLYRTSQDSPIVRALIRAAEAGKQVAALVELKARFDEENNIEWAQKLERTGAHVAYGLVGLKTHAKTTLVVREEAGGLKTYAHLGTGNYNPSTARFYTDFGLFTCREDIGEDLVGLFHFLTGYAPEQEYQSLAVAPRDLRPRFVELIRREIEHAKAGRKGRIIAKMNALDDVGIIQELYKASQAGVRVDLIIRGHTRMRPGVPGVSENVRIVSIVGRFLEHSRIYYFHNGGDPDILIGSADWMRRNLDDRVEVVLPVEDETARARLKRTLKFCLDDNRQAWDLGPDGRYSLRWPAEDEPVRAFHDTLMHRAKRRTEEDDAAWSF